VVVDSLKARNLSGKEAANYAVPRFAYSVALGLFTGALDLPPRAPPNACLRWRCDVAGWWLLQR
jgi:hypothetical protein